jgi:hypothetical protein
MSKRVSVHHFVVANLVRPESRLWLASDLFHVSYWLDVPADTEFPFIVPRLDVFVRFILRDTREHEFKVRLLWDDPAREIETLIGEYGPYHTPAARGWVIHDRSFNLHNIQLRGAGLHTVELHRVKRFPSGYTESVNVRETHFYVER